MKPTLMRYVYSVVCDLVSMCHSICLVYRPSGLCKYVPTSLCSLLAMVVVSLHQLPMRRMTRKQMRSMTQLIIVWTVGGR